MIRSGSNNSGWLTTKKRGRDDDAIEKAREAALRLRKERRSVGKTKKAAPRNTKTKRTAQHDSDDEDSIAEFVVDDDDDSLGTPVTSNAEDDEDEPVADADDLEGSDSNSDDEDSEGDTFFRKYKKRTSRPPPPLSRKPVGRSPPSILERLGRPKMKPPPAATASSRARDGAIDLCTSSSSDESGVQNPVLARKQKKKAAAAAPSKASSSAKQSLFLSSGGKVGSKRKGRGMLENNDDDDETPFCPTAIRKKPLLFNMDDDDDSSDEEEEQVAPPVAPSQVKKSDDDETPFLPTAIRKKPPLFKMNDDDSMDEDEQIALALAMSQSEMETKKPSNHKVSSSSSLDGAQPPGQEDDDSVIELQEDSDNDNDDAEHDDYVDPETREVQSVLQTANELSAQILQTLTEWSLSSSSSTATTDDSSSVTGSDTANVQQSAAAGLIASGALALSSIDHTRGIRHDWISAEEMATICPNVTLAEYQLIGVNWMALLHGMKCRVSNSKRRTNVNGILADEMGLGKTVQTIAFLSWLKHRRESSKNGSRPLPHLVIAPASVLSNWEREFQTFAPHMNVVKYHGTMTEREDIQEELRKHLNRKDSSSKRAAALEPLDVILAPITYFQKEKSDDRSFLRKFSYDYLVVDEAHLLKNARGTRYKTLDKFTTEHRLLLSGTPVQNNPKELLCLLCFLMPLFSRKSVDDDNDNANDGGESMLEHFVTLEGGDTDESAYRKLKQLFAPFVLRRRKQEVLSQVMPPKVQKVDFVTLDPTARKLYDSILSDHVQAKKDGSAKAREHLFTQLRKAAHHPLLIRARYLSEEEKEHLTHNFYHYGAFRGEGCTKARVAEELERSNDFQIHLAALELIEENPARRSDLERYTLTEDDLFSSSKFVRLRQLLPELIANGHRCLIFSVWTSCLDLITCLLENIGIEYLRMDGSTPVEERQDLIDRFNRTSSIPVFLLSTKACGLGINLTSADTCIFHDLDFNPMNDAQAEDRCHRIGNSKEVTVIRMVAMDTVDHDIYEMQQRKKKMSEVIMETNGSSSANDWSKEASKEKSMMLKTALDRFLKSPEANHESDIGEEDEQNEASLERDTL